MLCVSLSPQSLSLLRAILDRGRGSVRLDLSILQQTTIHPPSQLDQSCLTVQILTHKPSVLFVKTTHVHIVSSPVRSNGVQNLIHSVFSVHRRISSGILVKAPPAYSRSQVHNCCNNAGHGAVHKPPATLGESECRAPLPCLQNRPLQFPVLVPEAEPPRENAEALWQRGGKAGGHPHPNTTLLCSEIVSNLRDSVSDGMPDACGVELDRFAVFPCQHFYLFPDVLQRGAFRYGLSVVSCRRRPHQRPSPALRRSLEGGRRLLQGDKPLRLLTFMDILALSVSFPLSSSSRSSRATLQMV